MKIEKFKVEKFGKINRNKINAQEEVFFALSDKRYLERLSNNARIDVIDAMTFDQYKFFLKKNKIYKKSPYGSNYDLRQKKEQELIKKPEFVPIRTDSKKALKQALNLLNTCFTINKNVKKNAYKHNVCPICDGCGCDNCDGTGVGYTFVDYDLRDSEYAEKTKIIKKVINLIKNNLLPIKYGKNNGVVYFEYLGSQVSFHDPKNQIKNCKKFNGVWTKIRNKKIPYPYMTSR